MLDGVIRIVRSRRYRPLTALLPIEETVSTASGAFVVGIPWPWYVVDDDEAIPRAGVELLLSAPRTDGRMATIEFTVDPDTFELDDRMVSRQSREFARQVTGASAESPRRLIIGGIPAVEFVATAHPEQHRLLIVPDGAKTYRAQAIFPSGHAAGYGVHFDTILASWLWA